MTNPIENSDVRKNFFHWCSSVIEDVKFLPNLAGYILILFESSFILHLDSYLRTQVTEIILRLICRK